MGSDSARECLSHHKSACGKLLGDANLDAELLLDREHLPAIFNVGSFPGSCRGSSFETVRPVRPVLFLVSGSARLVQALIASDLVDQLNLMVFPIVLGSGKRLFGDPSEMKTLRLAESKPVGDSVLILVYRPA